MRVTYWVKVVAGIEKSETCVGPVEVEELGLDSDIGFIPFIGMDITVGGIKGRVRRVNYINHENSISIDFDDILIGNRDLKLKVDELKSHGWSEFSEYITKNG